jgi:hypothetical protein
MQSHRRRRTAGDSDDVGRQNAAHGGADIRFAWLDRAGERVDDGKGVRQRRQLGNPLPGLGISDHDRYLAKAGSRVKAT